MDNTDTKIYKATLEILKNGYPYSISRVAKIANLSRQTVYNKIEKYTFQDLDKFRSNINAI